jgi:subtilase family serine protease
VGGVSRESQCIRNQDNLNHLATKQNLFAPSPHERLLAAADRRSRVLVLHERLDIVVLQRLTKRGLPLLAAAALVAGPLAISAQAAPAASAQSGSAASVSINPAHIQVLEAALQNMHNNYASFANFSPGPQDIFNYNIGNLWMRGIDGTGTTVAVIEGWDDPGIAAYIKVRDLRYGLPDPDIETIFPSGPLPATCPAGMVALGSYGSCDAWVGELRLDVLAVHLIAPYAKIIISATPADSEITDDAASNVAPPEMMRALEDISTNHLANVISISDGTGEGTYSFGNAQIHANDPGPLAAAAAGIPVLNATGDCGVVQNLAIANAQCGNTSPGPASATWADNPWVTAVGGTVPNVSKTDGTKLGPDPLWHVGGIFAEGAGFSAVYPRPLYQAGVARITGSPWRSVPDITMDSQDGTSESAPMTAGVLALATQLNHGQNLGPINPVLYAILGPLGSLAGISDVVSGNNSVTDPNTGQVLVPGFTAGPGFDVASGWGTIDASKFVPALVTAQLTGLDRIAQLAASLELSRLQHNVKLSAGFIPPGGTSSVSDTGFLPEHPVQLAIDGTTITTLTASDQGTVSYVLNPSALGLSPGHHTLTLQSMLITTTVGFFSS